MPDWNPRANALFLDAAEIATPEQRTAFLDEQCVGDATLRAQVEVLLAASEKARTFLERPAAPTPAIHLPTGDYNPISETAGTVIGPFKLLQQIGEGGFGVVYMAQQEKPVRRLVALKIIKPGMDTASSSPGSSPSARPSRSWTTRTSRGSSTPGRPSPAGRTS